MEGKRAGIAVLFSTNYIFLAKNVVDYLLYDFFQRTGQFLYSQNHLRQMFRIFLSNPETFDGLHPAFCFCFLARFSLFVSLYRLNNLFFADFRHNITPHSVVSKFLLFRVSTLWGAYHTGCSRFLCFFCSQYPMALANV